MSTSTPNPQNLDAQVHDLGDLRRDYRRDELLEADVAANPIDQFSRWFDQARQAGELEPNAMVLSTADINAAPSARVVLLKEFDPDGFVFFTNYTSRKGVQLDENPQAALTFLWLKIERQVRIEGHIERVSRRQSEAYFHSRPRDSQLGAWVSHQSRVIASRQELEQRDIDLAQRFGDGPIPFPDFWGGYRLIPNRIEFWQGRTGRLHDRLEYRLQSGLWVIHRLAP